MRVFVTGGTGLIGRSIVGQLLSRGDSPVVLTRSESKAAALWSEGVEIVSGDPCYEGPWQANLAGCDAVINLVGEPLDAERWTSLFRQRIHDSRVDSTRFVAEGICQCEEATRPKLLMSASGIDYYGFAEIELFDDDEVTESDPGGESYLAGLCWDWEDETEICKEVGVRVAHMRTGLVLGKSGALSKLQKPFLRGFGGRLGHGRQWMSWVHVEDVARAYLQVLDSDLRGVINVVAPGNLRNTEFAQTLGKVLGRSSWLHVPPFAVRAVVGQLAEYILKGRRAVPAALVADGFEFRYAELEPALRDLL